VDKKYKSILEHIEENVKSKNVNVASLTIEYTNSKIHQLFIIIIKNYSFNKTDNSELLESLRVVGNTIYNVVKSNGIQSFNLVNTTRYPKYLETILEGVLLSSYRFNKYKTDQALNKLKIKFYIKSINLVLPEYTHSPKQITKLSNIVKSVFIARDLVNEPANTSKASRFITTIKQFISQNKLPIILEVLEQPQLEKLNMGLILGVGKGSSPENAPKILMMHYTGSNCSANAYDPAYVLLGKGITFDTGGLDLKSGKSMIEMKTDLSGASTVCAFLLGYAMNAGEKCITCICPFAENSIGPNATKPSDVLTAYDGKTVEITNTDAEGRLVLADCLAYVVDKYPNAVIVDFATLTGQQEAVSSKMFSNILAVNSDKEVAKMIASGKEINELLVPLPMMENQKSKLESYIADIKNVSFASSADIIMSSLFMRQFIKKNTKWIHIDIAGPSYKVDDVIKYASPEASGIGVRLLFNYFDK
jgi:leucyl aminopeptidase